MTESLSHNNPEQNLDTASIESDIFVADTISADEHEQMVESVQQQHDEKILAKQPDVSEALNAVNDVYSEGIIDSYQDANGRTWVEDSQGRHTMLKEAKTVPVATPESKAPGETADSSNESDETLATIEKLIDESKVEQEPQVSEQEQKGDVYDEKTAAEDLSALGLDEKATDMILGIQYNFQKKDFDEFLDTDRITSLMERVGMPSDRQEEFTAALEKVHTGLYPRSEQGSKDQVEETADSVETAQSENLHNVQMKLAKLSSALARVGQNNGGRLDAEIKRDVDRIIQEVVDSMTDELSAKMKRGEEINSDDYLRRSVKYLRDLDTRFDAGDLAMRLQRINRLKGHDIDK